MRLQDNEKRISSLKEKAKAMILQMTPEEKVVQTMHTAMGNERIGIPQYNWWNEALHGVARSGTATLFPQAIGLAATFDEELVLKIGTAISDEARAKYNMHQKHGDADTYKGLTFWAPNINIFRDPRWGRGQETYGEDPYLTARMGISYINGMQGDDENYLKTAACIKHFAVHSGPEELRHSFNAVVSKKDLYETYLPAFYECIKQARVEAVMGAYNRLNGMPCCGNKWLLTDLLRKEWGFDGHVVSDCFAIKDFHESHMVTETPTESAALAMNSGCDLNCGKMFLYLEDAIKSGKVSEQRIDEALEHLFVTRMKLGILGPDEEENPYDSLSYDIVDSEEMRKLNLEASRASIVLLKNSNNILPLNLDGIRTIGVIGPNADNRRALVGNYEGIASRYWTVLEGIQNYVGDRARIMYSEGCPMVSCTPQVKRREKRYFAETMQICEESDVIIACLGLDSSLEGEQGDVGNEFPGGDRPNVYLPEIQSSLLDVLIDSGKPVICILLSGGATSLGDNDSRVAAILNGWYPGAEGGRAIADILFGAYNPQGKTPVTFYRTNEELPAFEDYSMENRTYRFMKQEALYPFGFGLSYTDFSYRNVKALKEQLTPDGIDIETEVENVGEYAGTETIQLYVQAQRGNVPNPQLKAFRKVTLLPKEAKVIRLHVPLEGFYLYDEEGKQFLHEGKYKIFVGGNQPDKRSIELTEKEVSMIIIENTIK